MSSNREINGKKKTVSSKKRRSASRKKKPKVLLNSKYVCILCASIVFVCALLLGTAFLLSGMQESPSDGQPSGQFIEGGQPGGLTSLDAADKNAGKNTGKSGGKKAGSSGSAKNGALDKGASSATSSSTVKVPADNDSLGKASANNSGLSSADSSADISAGTSALASPASGSEVASVKRPGAPDSGIVESLPKFNIPPAINGAKLAFVIDDGGMSVANVKKYTSLPFPITVAVLPGLPHTAECAALVRREGKELMLHQPMQAKNLGINPGPGAITPDMDGMGIQQVIEKNLGELGPGVKGFNNHEGSLITEDKLKMTFIIDLAMRKGLYFLDSRTTSQTQASQAALELDTHIIERNAPFLDNAVTRDEVLKEIYKGLDVANRTGYAVIIGHVDKSAALLPKLLSDMYPELVAKGYVFTTPSGL